MCSLDGKKTRQRLPFSRQAGGQTHAAGAESSTSNNSSETFCAGSWTGCISCRFTPLARSTHAARDFFAFSSLNTNNQQTRRAEDLGLPTKGGMSGSVHRTKRVVPPDTKHTGTNTHPAQIVALADCRSTTMSTGCAHKSYPTGDLPPTETGPFP